MPGNRSSKLDDCNHFQDAAEDRLLQIRKTDDLLLEITDQKPDKVRRKRGVFIFVGEVSNI
jgi:hypothetical protein